MEKNNLITGGGYSEKEWNDIYKDGYLSFWPSENIVRFALRTYGNKKNAILGVKILDFGCGGGNNTWFLAKTGFQTYGCDGSVCAIELTRKRLHRENLHANLWAGNFLDLKYPDSFFDAIVDHYCIEANIIPDVAAILEKCHRILKPEGKLFSMMLSSDNVDMMKGEQIAPRTFSATTGSINARKRTIHFFTKDEARELIDKAGFQKLDLNFEVFSSKGGTVKVTSHIAEATKGIDHV